MVADNTNLAQFQYMEWIKVTPDHAVHLTYSKQVGTTSQLGHFYVQSTDRGQTWSVPFQLSATFAPTGFMGDYQGTDVGGLAGGSGVIFSSWTQSQGTGATEDRWRPLWHVPAGYADDDADGHAADGHAHQHADQYPHRHRDD